VFEGWFLLHLQCKSQKFKYHTINTILIIHFAPTWCHFPCLQFPTLISSGPPSHVSEHRKILPYRNQPADASIHWCSCISTQNCSNPHYMSSSLLLRINSFIFTMTKGGSLGKHWSHLYNVIDPIFGVGWAINIQTARFMRFFQHLSLTVFLMSYC
jgi:hypothetical protein